MFHKLYMELLERGNGNERTAAYNLCELGLKQKYE
jgi:hypothetical protein